MFYAAKVELEDSLSIYLVCELPLLTQILRKYLTIILRNRAEYHLILSRRGRRPSWLNQGIFRKIEQDNCFIIQQIPIDYHLQNEKNYGSMMKMLKLATHKLKLNKNQNRTSRNRSLLPFT